MSGTKTELHVLPSDALATTRMKPELRLSSRSVLDYLRPRPPIEAALSSQEASVAGASQFGGVGRPTSDESDARRLEFLRLVMEGADAPTAIKAARIKPERAAAILLEIARPALRVVERVAA